MAMTEEERFRFDLAGFFVRPAILGAGEVAAIVDQIERIAHDPASLPPEHRAMPGGPASVLIDHPQVMDVLFQVIGSDVRLEHSVAVWRTRGQSHGQGLHSGGPMQTDPIFGYRVQNGHIHAGMMRVVFELTDVAKDDGATVFLSGSHKSNFPIHPDHLRLEPGHRSEFLTSYACPAGSAVFFTEALCHAGPVWRREAPRVAVLHAYSHLAINYHRLTVPKEVLAGLPRHKQLFFRQPWIADFRTHPPTHNSVHRFMATDEPPIDTDTRP
jgi:Phytanoyl-CoA dioxygenase (PhyH)